MTRPAESKPTLEVVQSGMLSTIQDRGRYGYQRFGMPTAGAVDAFALRAANALLGNEVGAAGIEATVLGPRLKALANTRLAITGADVALLLDGEPFPMWRAVSVKEGSTLEFGQPREGMRAYLAVAGGIDVPLVMGSRATYMKAGIGGLAGRQLRAGDIINAFDAGANGGNAHLRFPDEAIPKYGSEQEVRVVLGPQHAAFTQAGIDTFLNSTYSVSIYSDRMGYRLEGEPIEHADGPDVISDGTPLGAIQVPGNGQPIILLADRGTTGGYTKIATVISTDISRVAQAMPGHRFRFRAVSVEAAQEAYRSQEALLNRVRRSASPAARIAVVMDSKVFDILDAGGEPIGLPSKDNATADMPTLRGKTSIGNVAFEFEINIRRLN